jgi:hypothetical protein
MTQDTLDKLTREAMVTARNELTVMQRLAPFAEAIHGGKPKALPFPPQMMDFRTALFKALGAYCKQTAAEALIFVSDAWTLRMSDEQMKRGEETMRYSMEHGLEDTAAAGYGTLAEIVTAVGQTKTAVSLIHQHYVRVAKDGIIPPNTKRMPPHTIRFEEEILRTAADDEVVVAGRMFVLYEPTPEQQEVINRIRREPAA